MAEIVKVIITAAAIVALAEAGKRAPLVAAFLLALPVATAATMIWMHVDGVPSPKIAAVAWTVFLYAIPSSVFVGIVALALWQGVEFWAALGVATALTGAALWGYTLLLAQWGVKLG
jgi:hypothetical protein